MFSLPAFLLPAVAIYNAIPSWLKKALLFGFIGLMIFAAGDQRGKRVMRAACEEQAKKAQTAADTQDKQAQVEVDTQSREIADQLTQQKKVDDATIESLRKQIAQRPAGAKCEYDKSNADPADEPKPRRVRHK